MMANPGSKSKFYLFLKPLPTLGGRGFSRAWQSMQKAPKRFLGNGVRQLPDTPDGTARFCAALPADIVSAAEKLQAYLFSQDEEARRRGFVPVHFIIDVSPGEDRAGAANHRLPALSWERLLIGRVHLCQRARERLPLKGAFKVERVDRIEGENPVFRLIPSGVSNRPVPSLFFFQNAIVQGAYPECFYCGDRRHAARECPTKRLDPPYVAIENLGGRSPEAINALFYESLVVPPPDPLTLDPTVDAHIPFAAFYELKRHIQLGIFRALWSDPDVPWRRLLALTNTGLRGGQLWLAQDCLRTGNLEQADALLKTLPHERHTDFSYDVLKALVAVESGDYGQAQRSLNRAVDEARSPAQGIYARFLLHRCCHLAGEPILAERRIDEVARMDRNCVEAEYEGIKNQFRQGRHRRAVRMLSRLIAGERRYFIHALIDPDLAEYHRHIQPELHRLLEHIRKRAQEAVPAAQTALERFGKMVGTDDNQYLQDKAQLDKIINLSGTSGYFGLSDTVEKADRLQNRLRHTITARKNQLLEDLQAVRERAKAVEQRASVFPEAEKAKLFAKQVQRFLADLTRLQARINDEASGVLREARETINGFSETVERMALQIQQAYEAYRLRRVIMTFIHKMLAWQALNLVIGFVVVPLAGYYFGCLLPELAITYREMVPYQKIALAAGGVLAILLAVVGTIKKVSLMEGGAAPVRAATGSSGSRPVNHSRYVRRSTGR